METTENRMPAYNISYLQMRQ